jgi:hypothetical protein
VDIKKQEFAFFSQVRQLVDISLDKKIDLNNKYVTIKECIALFGGSKKFNIKAHDLKLEDRITMEEIYYKLFGTSIITNNDMPTWIVHGYIVHTKGHPINWAKVVESTSKEKTSRDIIKNGRSGQVKKKNSTPCFDNGGSMNPNDL